MKKYASLTLAAGALALAGCAGIGSIFGPPIRAYAGPERADHQLAELVATRDLTPSVYAAFVSVDGAFYGDAVRGFPVTLKVLPGEHRVGISCGQAPHFRYPAMTAVFKPGHVYEFKCRYVGDGNVTAAMTDLGEMYAPPPPPKEKSD